jgi:hypothetical protein
MSEVRKSQAELKRERLAAALRENLKRRKARARAASKALTAETDDAEDENSRETAKK